MKNNIRRRRLVLLTGSLATGLCLLLLWSLQLGAQAAPAAHANRVTVAQATTNQTDIDPLPGGCIGGVPPGEDAPVCCLSGFVLLDGQPITNALVTLLDKQGVIAQVQTQVYDQLNPQPTYHIDLTHLTRPVTPTDVITVYASYSGITSAPVRYTVQPGGQRLNLVIYNMDALALGGQTHGEAALGTFSRVGQLAVDSQGNVYSADVINHRIQVFSPDGAFLRTWGTVGDLPNQFGQIQSIALDKRTDTVYILDEGNHRIVKYTTAGDRLDFVRADGQRLPFISSPVERPWALNGNASDLQVDGQGSIYVLAYNGGLFKFAPDGRWLPWAQWQNAVDAWLVARVPLAVAPDGRAYSFKNNIIYRFDEGVPVALTTILTDGQPLSTTWGLAFSADITDGHLYVAERDNPHTRVIKLAIKPNNILQQEPWNWQPPTGNDAVTYFGAMTFDDQTNYLYISGYVSNRIWQFHGDGGYSRSWGGTANNDGQLADPQGIAISPTDGALYVADPLAQRISKIVSDTIVQSWAITDVHMPAGLRFTPNGLAFDAQGRLLMTGNHQVKRFVLNGNQITFDRVWGDYGPGVDQFGTPQGVVMDRSGYLYIAETANNRIKIATLQNDTLQVVAILTGTTAIDPLRMPRGIAVDDSDPNAVIVYVAEPGNASCKLGRDKPIKFTFVNHQTIQAVTLWGTNGWGDVNASAMCPHGLAVDAGHNLYVADWAVNQVRKFDRDGNLIANYGVSGYGPGALASPSDVALDSRGNLFVSDETNGRIVRFKPLTPGKPVATIVHLSSADLVPGDVLTAVGAGQDGDVTHIIDQYEWTTNDGFTLNTVNTTVDIPTGETATTADKLGPGVHLLQLRVHSDKGGWSDPATYYVNVARRRAAVLTPTPTSIPGTTPTPTPPSSLCPAGSLWTFLLYLDADYKDEGKLSSAYSRARDELGRVNNACVQFAIQIDGPASIGQPLVGDARRWLVRPGQAVGEPMEAGEVNMDAADTLANFIIWGQHELPADHYYLAIADHGDGARGIAWDHTTDPHDGAYLTAAKIRSVLERVDVEPIDILHLDACSMGLLDVAYQLRAKVKYLIASQYLGWGFFAYADYAQEVNQIPDAAQVAKNIVNRYATLAESYGYPYTLAAWDLTRVEPVKNGVDALAVLLKAWVDNDNSTQDRHHQLTTLRNASQQFDSDGNFINSPLDAYIDLTDLLTRLSDANLNAAITLAANQLGKELQRSDSLILANSAQSHNLPPKYHNGDWANLEGAHGVSVYYPLEGELRLALPPQVVAAALQETAPYSYSQVYADYITNQLFDFTLASRWDDFLRVTYGTPNSAALLATPLPPAAPLDVPTPTATPSPTPMPTTTPASTPTATATPTQTPEGKLEAKQRYRLEQDGDGNHVISAGDILLFETTIQNTSTSAVTDVALVEDLGNNLTFIPGAEEVQATAINPVEFAVGSIGAGETAQVSFRAQVQQSSAVDPLIGVTAQLKVGGQLQGSIPITEQQFSVYLPLIRR